MRKVWGILLVVVALASVGAACSGDGDDDDASTAGDDAAEEAGQVLAARDESAPMTTTTAPGVGGASTGGIAFGQSSSAQPLPPLDVNVVRTADLRIEVEKGTFTEKLREASSLARVLGGFVQSSSTTSFDEGEASGEVTLRVPVDRYDDAMARLADLGRLEHVAEEGEDVTGQLVDLDARLRALRAEEEALNALMAEAANVNEVLSIRSTSVGIRSEIEQLAAQQASLEDRAAFSTIHAVLHEASAEIAATSPGDDDWSLGDAVDTALDAGEAMIGAAIVAVGVAVPLLPFAAVAAWYALRRNRRPAAATEG